MKACGSVIRHTNRQAAIQAAKQDNELDKTRLSGQSYIPPPVHFPVIVSVANGVNFPVKIVTKECVKEIAFQMMADGCTQVKAAAVLKRAYPRLQISQSLISKWIVDQRKLQEHPAIMLLEQSQEQISPDDVQVTSNSPRMDSPRMDD